LEYPYVTSRDITVSAALNDAGLHPSALGKILMSVRTCPIRVGNIRDEHGKEIGYSGPCYPDQKELTWKELDQEPELTTVTKRIRRIFNWSPLQYQKALGVLRPDFTFINFVNYLKSEEQFNHFMYAVNEAEITAKHQTKKIFGIGPNVEDVYTTVAPVILKQWRKK
jgi:adenylosuccinate synthase